MKNIFLQNIHFAFFDQWFANLSEKEQHEILEKTPGVEKYAGIELVTETFDEQKGFEFKIVDQDKWNLAKQKHDFLSNI